MNNERFIKSINSNNCRFIFATFILKLDSGGNDKMKNVIKLYVEDNKTIEFDKEKLIAFITNDWEYESLENFLNEYIYTDTLELSTHENLLYKGGK